MTVTPQDLRDAFACCPSPVAVLTRRLPDGTPYGMTVGSFTSVSLEPPLILVCISKVAGFSVSLPDRLVFVVNVLSEVQEPLARRFASRDERDRFAGVEWSQGTEGAPLLSDCVRNLTCLLHQRVEAGDHLILIGLVLSVECSANRPLVWCDRTYHSLPKPASLQS
jgi:flavin reductase (DIM6/NTAB) family NADH-FMN oxidoreductase RutF